MTTDKETPGIQGRCPYCDISLGKPEMDYHQGGASRATWECECGAVIVHINYPPPEKEEA